MAEWMKIIGKKQLHHLKHETTTECNDICKCPCIQRVTFIFKQFSNNQECFEALVLSLEHYNRSQFLADNEHILYCHNNDENSEHELFQIFKKHTDECHMQNCIMFRRNYRDRLTVGVNNQRDRPQVQSTPFMDLVDSYHCYYSHSNNFTEDNEDELKTEKTVFIASSKFTTSIADKPNNTLPVYQFGVDMTYHATHENMAFFLYIIPAFPDLKHELLHNPYYQLALDEWNKTYQEVELLYNCGSPNVKTANRSSGISRNKLDNKNRIEEGQRIKIDHLVAAKVYTDYTKLQKEFKKHCRLLNENDTEKQVALQNTKIAHFCRLLKELVTYFGERNEELKLYHGIDKKMIFPRCNFSVFMALSMTTDVNIATCFQNDQGIILQVTRKNNAAANSFDMSWLSRYKNEKEQFFYGGLLEIYRLKWTFRTKSRWIKNEIIALRMLQSIFHSLENYNDSALNDIDMRNNDAQNELQRMIERYLRNNIQSETEKYFDEWLQMIARRKLNSNGGKIPYFHIAEAMKLNADLRRYFMIFDANHRLTFGPFLQKICNGRIELKCVYSLEWNLNEHDLCDLVTNDELIGERFDIYSVDERTNTYGYIPCQLQLKILKRSGIELQLLLTKLEDDHDDFDSDYKADSANDKWQIEYKILGRLSNGIACGSGWFKYTKTSLPARSSCSFENMTEVNQLTSICWDIQCTGSFVKEQKNMPENSEYFIQMQKQYELLQAMCADL
eukprot:51392_1